MRRHVIQRKTLQGYTSIQTPDKMVKQLGPTCQVHAYFHYIFTHPDRLYRYLTMEGWNRMVAEMMKDEEQNCLPMRGEEQEFFKDNVEWRYTRPYFIDERGLNGYDMYNLITKEGKDGVLHTFYVSSEWNEKVYQEIFRSARRKFSFKNNLLLHVQNKFEQIGLGALNEVGKFTKRYGYPLTNSERQAAIKDAAEREDEHGKKYVIDEPGYIGHTTAFTRGQIIDSNGDASSYPRVDFFYLKLLVLECERSYCTIKPGTEIDETPDEMKFMDRIYDKMVGAENFTRGLTRRIIESESPKKERSRITEDMETIPMQSFEDINEGQPFEEELD